MNRAAYWIQNLSDSPLIYWSVIMSVVCFAAMGIDKFRAKTRKWRIPEKALFLIALLGGAFGGILGMYVFRHKTRHASFVMGMPLMLIINLAAYCILSRLIW